MKEKSGLKNGIWETLGQKFDSSLTRRSGIMLKPDDGSRFFVYPDHPGTLGYLFDEGLLGCYEEDPFLSIKLEQVFYPSALGTLSETAPLSMNHQLYYPDCVCRTATLATAGFTVHEKFCRPLDNAFLWQMDFHNHADYPRRNVLMFVVFSAPVLSRISKVNDGFVFRPGRPPVNFDEKGNQIKISPKHGIDSRPAIDRQKDPSAGNFDISVAMDAVDWGVYDHVEDYRAAINSGKLNQTKKGSRYLVAAFRTEPQGKHETRFDPTQRKNESLTDFAQRLNVVPDHKKQHTFRMGISFVDVKHARKTALCKDPIRKISNEWNKWFSTLQPAKTKTKDERKAYYKSWWVVRLNQYNHPRFGVTISEAPVYPGYWICNVPTMELVSAKYPGLKHRFFKNGMDMFCAAMSKNGVFPHAIYLREKKPGTHWLRPGMETASIPNTAWPVLAYYEKTRDIRSLRKWYPYLKRYYAHLSSEHDPDGLHLWCINTLHDSFDETPTSDLVWRRKEKYAYTPDYSAERVTYEQAMERIARVIGNDSDTEFFRASSETTLAALHRFLWDTKNRWFGVRHADGSLDSRIGLPGLYPLAYGLATREQAKSARPGVNRLICRYGVRTFAKKQAGYSETYWRGPVWATSILYGFGAAQRYYPELIKPVYDGMIRYILAHPNIWELLDGDIGKIAATDFGFFAGTAYGGASLCGTAALLSVFYMHAGESFLPTKCKVLSKVL